jgi:hemolysin activation/secretion protein
MICRCILILAFVLVYSASLSAAPFPGPLPNEGLGAVSPEQKLSVLPKTFVKGFAITGNIEISTEELLRVAQPYTNRELVMEQLEELRQALISFYVHRGYINSGVIIPDQVVKDGIIHLVVIEGRLIGIEISGLNHFQESYIRDRLAVDSQGTLNLNRLQESLQLLQQDQRIKRINADLQPGIRPGEAYLKVKVQEESPYLMTLRFNNDGSPSTGVYRGEVNFAHRNLLGLGDPLTVDLAVTEGALDIGAGYTVPLTSRDTALAIYYRHNESTVIEEVFSNLDIKSDSDTYGIRLRQPLLKTVAREFAISLAGEYRESHSFLLGRSFSFSPGEHNGVAKVTVLRLGQEFVKRGSNHLLVLNSTFNLGLAALGSTTNAHEPDSRFFSWLGQLMLLSRLGESSTQVMLRTNAQVSANGLLPLERFGLGGLNSVRGYRSNLLVRDNGVNSSLELRVPLTRPESNFGAVNFVPFIDFGWGWNTDQATPSPSTITGIGGGLQWRPTSQVLLEAYYGYGLTNVKLENKELSDQGIYVQMTAEVF